MRLNQFHTISLNFHTSWILKPFSAWCFLKDVLKNTLYLQLQICLSMSDFLVDTRD